MQVLFENKYVVNYTYTHASFSCDRNKLNRDSKPLCGGLESLLSEIKLDVSRVVAMTPSRQQEAAYLQMNMI